MHISWIANILKHVDAITTGSALILWKWKKNIIFIELVQICGHASLRRCRRHLYPTFINSVSGETAATRKRCSRTEMKEEEKKNRPYASHNQRPFIYKYSVLLFIITKLLDCYARPSLSSSSSSHRVGITRFYAGTPIHSLLHLAFTGAHLVYVQQAYHRVVIRCCRAVIKQHTKQNNTPHSIRACVAGCHRVYCSV